MKLIDFGKRSGLKVAPVSIGSMRLPRDVSEAVKLIRHAIDSGMRYIDTSRGYTESEFVLGCALRDGYREKVILSTKCSPWITKVRPTDDTSAEKVFHRIKESMIRLGVDYLDYYQIWNIDSREHYNQATEAGGMLDGIRMAQAEGLVRRTGFTTHDNNENLLDYISEADWCDIILITYNLLNTSYAPVLKAAHDKGIGTIVMNPMGGGGLAEDSPILQSIADDFGSKNMADLAIRYVLSNPNVDTIVCGMTKISDVDNTIAASKLPKLSATEIERLDAKIESLSSKNVGFCTKCKYCLPCPQGIDIPTILSANYELRVLGRKDMGQRIYNYIKGPKASDCTKCKQCETKCTQKLKIINEMAFAKENFEKDEKNGK